MAFYYISTLKLTILQTDRRWNQLAIYNEVLAGVEETTPPVIRSALEYQPQIMSSNPVPYSH